MAQNTISDELNFPWVGIPSDQLHELPMTAELPLATISKQLQGKFKIASDAPVFLYYSY